MPKKKKALTEKQIADRHREMYGNMAQCNSLKKLVGKIRRVRG